MHLLAEYIWTFTCCVVSRYLRPVNNILPNKKTAAVECEALWDMPRLLALRLKMRLVWGFEYTLPPGKWGHGVAQCNDASDLKLWTSNFDSTRGTTWWQQSAGTLHISYTSDPRNLLLPGTSSSRPAQEPLLSSPRPLLATPWRPARSTLRPPGRCRGTHCPALPSSLRSRPSTARGGEKLLMTYLFISYIFAPEFIPTSLLNCSTSMLAWRSLSDMLKIPLSHFTTFLQPVGKSVLR